MKKFGTPIGAGPGSANENVGLDGVGTPSWVTGGGGDACLVALFVPDDDLVVVLVLCVLEDGFLDDPEDPWLEDGCFLCPDPVVVGGFGGLVEPPPPPEWPWEGGGGVVVVVVGVVPVLVGVGVVPVDVVVVVVGVVVVAGVVAESGQDSVTDLIGWVMFSDETGAPSGSWKYSVWPSVSVTVTVQLAAEAAGSAATLRTAAITPIVVSATFSFTRLNTVVARFLRYGSSGVRPHQDHGAAVSRASY